MVYKIHIPSLLFVNTIQYVRPVYTTACLSNPSISPLRVGILYIDTLHSCILEVIVESSLYIKVDVPNSRAVLTHVYI